MFLTDNVESLEIHRVLRTLERVQGEFAEKRRRLKRRRAVLCGAFDTLAQDRELQGAETRLCSHIQFIKCWLSNVTEYRKLPRRFSVTARSIPWNEFLKAPYYGAFAAQVAGLKMRRYEVEFEQNSIGKSFTVNVAKKW